MAGRAATAPFRIGNPFQSGCAIYRVASPFEVLDIDPDASEADLRRAYRERIIKAHPDHGGSTAEFQRVRAAYEAAKAGRELEAPPEQEEIEEEPEPDDGPDGAHVEYLNYAVLDDHGWDVGDSDLFGKAGDADLDPVNHGKFVVEPGESLLEAAENRGFAWPYACRGGACANCAVAVVEGELEMPADTILPPEMKAHGIRLSCNGIPVTDEMKVIYNIKHLPGLDELRLPPRPFEQAHASD